MYVHMNIYICIRRLYCIHHRGLITALDSESAQGSSSTIGAGMRLWVAACPSWVRVRLDRARGGVELWRRQFLAPMPPHAMGLRRNPEKDTHFSGVCAFENLGILNCDKGVDLVANTGKIQVLCILIFYRTGYYRDMHSRDTLIDYFCKIHTVCILNSWDSWVLSAWRPKASARGTLPSQAFLGTLKCEVHANGRGCNWKRD